MTFQNLMLIFQFIVGTINKPASPTPQQQSLKSSTDETSPPTSPPTSPKVANLRQRFEKPGLKVFQFTHKNLDKHTSNIKHV